jgi:hypothetical protein
MKMIKPVLKPLALVASTLICYALNLHAQSAPTITTQPVSQTVVNGTNVTFSVQVSGAGPFTYQWQFNGANLPDGIITTVAGNGTMGYSGDGGSATNAELFFPEGMVVDGVGNLYIADCNNNRVREVGTNGIITTVAGNGTNGYSGDDGAATNAELNLPVGVTVDGFGNLYISDNYKSLFENRFLDVFNG